jgi:hypothetical protein
VLKTLALVALVLLIVLLAIPLGIGTVMCPECPSVGMAPMATCFAILAGLLVLAIFGTSGLSWFTPRCKVLLLARSLERPPRFA